jgi:hypothetical protein
MGVVDAHKQVVPWKWTRSSDLSLTLYHIVAWRFFGRYRRADGPASAQVSGRKMKCQRRASRPILDAGGGRAELQGYQGVAGIQRSRPNSLRAGSIVDSTRCRPAALASGCRSLGALDVSPSIHGGAAQGQQRRGGRGRVSWTAWTQSGIPPPMVVVDVACSAMQSCAHASAVTGADRQTSGAGAGPARYAARYMAHQAKPTMVASSREQSVTASLSLY